MNRNRLITIAMIVFLIICAICYPLVDSSKWSALIAAVTASAWLMAVSDNWRMTYTSRKNHSERQLTTNSEQAAELSSMKEYVDRTIPYVTHDDSLKEMFELIHHSIDAMIKDTNESIDKLKKKNKKVNTRILLANILYVTAFVLFLSILYFDPLTSVFIKQQDVLTLAAFTMLLINQVGEEIFNQQFDEFVKNNELLINKVHELCEKARECEKKAKELFGENEEKSFVENRDNHFKSDVEIVSETDVPVTYKKNVGGRKTLDKSRKQGQTCHHKKC